MYIDIEILTLAFLKFKHLTLAPLYHGPDYVGSVITHLSNPTKLQGHFTIQKGHPTKYQGDSTNQYHPTI